MDRLPEEEWVLTGTKCLGAPRFPWGSQWSPPTPTYRGLENKDGYAFSYLFDGGQFTTVTRVIAATEGGAAKAIISYALDALSPEEAKLSEPWKKGDLKGKMVLMRLRVMETSAQLALFGWNTIQRELIRIWIGTTSSHSMFL